MIKITFSIHAGNCSKVERVNTKTSVFLKKNLLIDMDQKDQHSSEEVFEEIFHVSGYCLSFDESKNKSVK